MFVFRYREYENAAYLAILDIDKSIELPVVSHTIQFLIATIWMRCFDNDLVETFILFLIFLVIM